MIQEDVIQPENTKWASPIVFAPKKGGLLRYCVDCRKTQRDESKGIVYSAEDEPKNRFKGRSQLVLNN